MTDTTDTVSTSRDITISLTKSEVRLLVVALMEHTEPIQRKALSDLENVDWSDVDDVLAATHILNKINREQARRYFP